MSAPIARALLRDAFAQVVDNLVFRLLLVLLAVCVLPTFLVRLDSEGVLIAYFLRYRWEDIGGRLLELGAADQDAHLWLIERIQTGVSDQLAGKLGVLLCVVATAFFVPRMLEKGAADTLFSKPVSRGALLLSRYFAGLLFVTVLAVGLVGGMHLGFSLVSGHSVDGFLWSIPMLVYLFAVMHAFSVTVGVITRSSVAAILLTAVFFMGTSCLQAGWEIKQFAVESELAESLNDAESEGQGQAELPGFVRALAGGLDVAHLVLPRTRDARRLTELLRDELERPRGSDGGPELLDAATGLSLTAPPAGFERLARGPFARDGAVWTAPEPGGGESRLALEPADPALEHGKTAIRALEDQLASNPNASELEPLRGPLAGRAGQGLRWREERQDGPRRRERWYFQGQDRLFALDVDVDHGLAAAGELDATLAQFLQDLHFAGDADPFAVHDPWQAYEDRFTWDAPLPYNAWYSLASTLAFAGIALAVGWWRLSRIDF